MNIQMMVLNNICNSCGNYGQSGCAICSIEGLRQVIVTESMKHLKNRKLASIKAEVKQPVILLSLS